MTKTHYYDSLCVGEKLPEKFNFKTPKVYKIKAYGRGSRYRGRHNACGIITSNVKCGKRVEGFQTGDIVKAEVTEGKKIGSYIGRVAIRETGYFNISTENGTVQGINHKYCKIIQRSDGYSYSLEDRKVISSI
jgi:hypothetical protein